MAKLVFILLALGVVLAIRFFHFYSHAQILPENTALTITTTLLNDPKPDGTRQQFRLATSQGALIFVTTSRFPTYHYGQTLKLTGKLKRVGDGSKRLYRMDFPKITTEKDYSNPLLAMAGLFRGHVGDVFSRSLPYPYSPLLVGIVFGVREGMSDSLKDALSQTGVIHITAASGMNITMLAGAVFFILSGVLKRKGAILVSTLIIWIYAAISGFDASITRAALMATIAFSAGILGRQNTAWYALALTGFLMLFVSPQTIFDIGFQLSFASTAGILFLVPLMKRGKDTTPGEGLWFLKDDLTTTVAAQLATIPVLLAHFGTFSPFAILVNLMILWTIPPLMILGGLGALVSFISPVFSLPFLYLSLPLLWYINQVVEFSSRIFPHITFETFPLSLSVGYYFMLLVGTLFLYRRREKT